RGATEKFTITYLANDQVTLQGSNGRYVSAENGTKAMTCNRLSPGVQETFTLVDQPNGSVALQGANGQYLRGNMLCTSPSVGTWQQWNLEGGLTKSLEAELSPLKVFPNPLRTGALVVNWGETELPQTVEVIDLKGALIYRATGLRGQAHKLPRTAFRGAGLYVLRVGDRTTTRFEKVVVH
ncbi:MAG: T9SS type A sorting domain-containing protein, partial [Bacteroidota bacterium]